MILKRPWVVGLCHIFLLCFFNNVASGAATARDSLTLHQPENVSVIKVMNPRSRTFIVYIKFDDIPNTDSTGAFIHQPDTSYWSTGTPQALLSVPSTRGSYAGDIDRTIQFRVIFGGEVGVTENVIIRYDILWNTQWFNEINIGDGYTPGSWIDLVFRNQTIPDTLLELGLQVTFTGGMVDERGTFRFGCEDFEGFHVWRGIEPDGSDMISIAELSKEEAARGSFPGGSVTDSLYFFGIIPALRESGVYFFPVAVNCIGARMDFELDDNEYLWVDCNAFNGFTYYYAVTTFDRGYNILAGSQGLNKIESCLPVFGEPFECRDDLVEVSIDVLPQNNMMEVFAVPNPYRTGGSAYTTENYHNFPDKKIRFVNVPADCILKVYTVSGDLVWETEHHSPDVGNIEWDVKNASGEDISSGIYIYRVETPEGNEVYGRLIVIR